jgi:hypothetical protein
MAELTPNKPSNASARVYPSGRKAAARRIAARGDTAPDNFEPTKRVTSTAVWEGAR